MMTNLLNLNTLSASLSKQYDELASKELSSLTQEFNVQIDKIDTTASKVIINLQRTSYMTTKEIIFEGNNFLHFVPVCDATVRIEPKNKELKQIILKHLQNQEYSDFTIMDKEEKLIISQSKEEKSPISSTGKL